MASASVKVAISSLLKKLYNPDGCLWRYHPSVNAITVSGANVLALHSLDHTGLIMRLIPETDVLFLKNWICV